jgi:hypothetical protein
MFMRHTTSRHRSWTSQSDLPFESVNISCENHAMKNLIQRLKCHALSECLRDDKLHEMTPTPLKSYHLKNVILCFQPRYQVPIDKSGNLKRQIVPNYQSGRHILLVEINDLLVNNIVKIFSHCNWLLNRISEKWPSSSHGTSKRKSRKWHHRLFSHQSSWPLKRRIEIPFMREY